MGALGLGTKPRMRRSITVGEQSGADMDAVVSARSGEVLGRSTILKSDHFPGCQNVNLPEKIEGAPNFREVGLQWLGEGFRDMNRFQWLVAVLGMYLDRTNAICPLPLLETQFSIRCKTV